jgi:hypothetical protein
MADSTVGKEGGKEKRGKHPRMSMEHIDQSGDKTNRVMRIANQCGQRYTALPGPSVRHGQRHATGRNPSAAHSGTRSDQHATAARENIKHLPWVRVLATKILTWPHHDEIADAFAHRLPIGPPRSPVHNHVATTRHLARPRRRVAMAEPFREANRRPVATPLDFISAAIGSGRADRGHQRGSIRAGLGRVRLTTDRGPATGPEGNGWIHQALVKSMGLARAPAPG